MKKVYPPETQKDSIDAVVAGHICLDVIPDLSGTVRSSFANTFLPGSLLEVGPVTFCTGGPVSNTGLALNKLGIETQLMGKVGTDLLGRAVEQILQGYAEGLADGLIRDDTASTSYSVIISPPGVDRIFLHCPGANDTFSAADVHYELLAGVRLFHFGYPPLMKLMYQDGGRQLVEVFQRAKETGVTTSLDMALPDPSSAAGQVDWVSILESTLPYVDLFLPSIEEILYMLQRDIYDDLCLRAGGPDILPLITPELLTELSQRLLTMGVKIIVLKLGKRGLYLRTAGPKAIASMGRAQPSDTASWANREIWELCFQVEVVGTTGSGDATIAGFLSALLRDMSPKDAAVTAVAVGACNVEAADALSGIRPWNEVQRRIAAGWPQLELD